MMRVINRVQYIQGRFVGVSDSCINTSPRLVRKYARVFSADTTKTFSACILIVIASLNCARKSRFFLTMQQRKQINF